MTKPNRSKRRPRLFFERSAVWKGKRKMKRRMEEGREGKALARSVSLKTRRASWIRHSRPLRHREWRPHQI
jgi:hypothetical protein